MKAQPVCIQGHENFETCVSNSKTIYLPLKAKGPVVAQELGVPEGHMVFKKMVKPS